MRAYRPLSGTVFSRRYRVSTHRRRTSSAQIMSEVIGSAADA